jgi:peptide/nickel transport system ATP-binding protein
MSAILETAGLRKVFGDHVAVDDVSFSLPAGGSLGIVGESGSGKTTVARLVTGLERATAGTIAVAGHDRSHPARRAVERRRRGRELQIVLQDPYTSLDPRQTVGSCLDEVLRLHFDLHRERRRARIGELLHAVGLEARYGAATPRAMSGGQRQRVAIARALAAEPQVLLLDEAVSALDVSIQAQILNLLDDLRRETGIAFLFISHNLAVVRQVCDDALVMRAGRVVERGRVDTLLDTPAEPYTRLLRASVPHRGWRPQRRPATEQA